MFEKLLKATLVQKLAPWCSAKLLVVRYWLWEFAYLNQSEGFQCRKHNY